MANGTQGAFHFNLRCYRLDDRHIVTAQLDDLFVEMITDGGEASFVIPIDDGRFSVSRFSLAGSLQATGLAATIAERRRNESQEGLRDFTI